MSGIHDVRMYHGSMPGITAGYTTIGNANTASKIITILNLCLVDGFNLNTVTSITVAGGVATATTPTAHGFSPLQVIRIAGADIAELNGDWKCTDVLTTTFTFPTTAADGTATGTMSAKVAPLGWTMPFTGTNLAVYQGQGPNARFLQVNDPAQYITRFRAYHAMTDASTGTGPFPTSVQNSLGIGFNKYSGIPGADRWYLIGDGKFFYFLADPYTSLFTSRGTHGPSVIAFGEIPTYVTGDSVNHLLCGLGSAATNTALDVTDGLWANYGGYSSASLGISGLSTNTNSLSPCACGNYLEGAYTQTLGSPVLARFVGHGLSGGWGGGNACGAGTNTHTPAVFPNQGDGASLFHAPVLVIEHASRNVRGILPGTYQPLASGMQALHSSTVTLGDRAVLLLRAPDGSNQGLMGFDITGPWR